MDTKTKYEGSYNYNIMSDKNGFGMARNIQPVDHSAYIPTNTQGKSINFQKKTTKSICFPIIQSPLKDTDDDPMNTKHFQ